MKEIPLNMQLEVSTADQRCEAEAEEEGGINLNRREVLWHENESVQSTYEGEEAGGVAGKNE